MNLASSLAFNPTEGADLPEADSLWTGEQQGEQDMHKIKKALLRRSLRA